MEKRGILSKYVQSMLWCGLVCTMMGYTRNTALAQSAPIRIGVYYYPGWTPRIPMALRSDPWAPIRKFPQRMPAKGEYSDDSPVIMRQQLDEMNSGGISFVAFDVFTGPDGSPRSDQAIRAYLSVARVNKDPKLALMWDNSYSFIKSSSDWDKIIKFWTTRYLTHPNALHIINKPVVFIFSANKMDELARNLGMTTEEMLDRAQIVAKSLGTDGIFFVAGVAPNSPFLNKVRDFGYNAVSEYNLGSSGHGFTNRDQSYRRYWSMYEEKSPLPVVLPMTVGWDRTPWGGSTQDNSRSDPNAFAVHTRAAIQYLQKGRSEENRVGVICCWNEYGEGSVLEPTRQYSNSHLLRLKREINNTNLQQ